LFTILKVFCSLWHIFCVLLFPMMMNDPNQNAKPDWNQLAKEALDLWQNHLTSLAADPKAKEEMVKLVAPMSHMFSSWTDLMQQSLQGFMTPEAEPSSAAPAQKEPVAEAVPDTPMDDVAEEDVSLDDEFQEEASQDNVCEQEEPSRDELLAAMADFLARQNLSVQAPVSEAAPVEPQAEAVPDEHAAVSCPDEPCADDAGPSAGEIEPSLPRGSTIPPDSARNLAELATRLAFLERELGELRARKKDAESDADASEAGQHVAGSHQG
jgi:hypothetical protein